MAKIKIRKKEEVFSEKKLRASLKKAGAIPKAIKAAIEAVKKRLKKGMSTADIRRIVNNVLKKLDPKALKKYTLFKKKK